MTYARTDDALYDSLTTHLVGKAGPPTVPARDMNFALLQQRRIAGVPYSPESIQ